MTMVKNKFYKREPVTANAPNVGESLEGARSATGGDSPTFGVASLLEGQRWSARRKFGVVQRLIAGESLEIVSREIGVPIYQLEDWRDRAIIGIEDSLKIHLQDPNERKLTEAQRRIGELTMENELLRERCRRAAGPLMRGKSAK